jgi:hypothetical protein
MRQEGYALDMCMRDGMVDGDPTRCFRLTLHLSCFSRRHYARSLFRHHGKIKKKMWHVLANKGKEGSFLITLGQKKGQPFGKERGPGPLEGLGQIGRDSHLGILALLLLGRAGQVAEV